MQLPTWTQLADRRERRMMVMSVRRRFGDRASLRRAGIKWTVPPWDEYIAWYICADGSYDAERRDRILERMRAAGRIAPGRDLVIDVGANFGSHTLPFALQGCRVLAIEPAPEQYDLLLENVRRNRLDGVVRCHRGAIGRQAGPASMILPNTNGGGGELARPGRAPTFAGELETRAVVEVELESLDQVLRDAEVDPSEVAFVWSDTQGCEAEVIGSGGPLWSAGVPLYAELWPRGLEQQGAVEDFLALAAGYFKSYILADDLVAGRPHRRPVAKLEELIERSGWRADEAWQTDVLLLHETP